MSKKDPEIHEPVPCPHCGKQLLRMEMNRDDGPDGPRWIIRIAGKMNAAAMKGVARLLKGWAEQ